MRKLLDQTCNSNRPALSVTKSLSMRKKNPKLTTYGNIKKSSVGLKQFMSQREIRKLKEQVLQVKLISKNC